MDTRLSSLPNRSLTLPSISEPSTGPSTQHQLLRNHIKIEHNDFEMTQGKNLIFIIRDFMYPYIVCYSKKWWLISFNKFMNLFCFLFFDIPNWWLTTFMAWQKVEKKGLKWLLFLFNLLQITLFLILSPAQIINISFVKILSLKKCKNAEFQQFYWNSTFFDDIIFCKTSLLTFSFFFKDHH